MTKRQLKNKTQKKRNNNLKLNIKYKPYQSMNGGIY